MKRAPSELDRSLYIQDIICPFKANDNQFKRTVAKANSRFLSVVSRTDGSVFPHVIAGLDPAIHCGSYAMDPRIKSGGDGKGLF